MNWDDLRLILALRRNGTMTTAAQVLGVARTTVGRRLLDAERRWGARLFDRTPDGLVATPAGEELAATAAHLEGEILAAEGRVRGRDAELRGRLRVSTVDFVFDCVPELFGSFAARYPHVDLTVGVSDDFACLARREADVALRMANRPAEHLIGRRVGRVQFDVYAAHSLVQRIGPDAPLSAYPWVHWDELQDAGFLDRFLDQRAPGASVVFRSADYAVRRSAVLAGVGVHHLPCPDGDRHPELVHLGGRLEEQARDLWLLTLPDLRHNRRIRAFMDHAQAALREASVGRWGSLDGQDE